MEESFERNNFSKGTLASRHLDSQVQSSEDYKSLQVTVDFMLKRMNAQEEAHKDLLRIVKLLQAYNENQDAENTRVREEIKDTTQIVLLVEERLVTIKRQGEIDLQHLMNGQVQVREDL